jgi:hypothetical protein
MTGIEVWTKWRSSLEIGDASNWEKGETAAQETEGTQWENLLDLSHNIDLSHPWTLTTGEGSFLTI